MQINRSILLGLLVVVTLSGCAATCPPPACSLGEAAIPNLPIDNVTPSPFGLAVPSFWMAYTTPLGRYGGLPVNPKRIDAEVYSGQVQVIAPTRVVDFFVAPTGGFDVERFEFVYDDAVKVIPFDAKHYRVGGKSHRFGVVYSFVPGPGKNLVTVRTVFRQLDPQTGQPYVRPDTFTVLMSDELTRYRNPRLLLPYAPPHYSYGLRHDRPEPRRRRCR